MRLFLCSLFLFALCACDRPVRVEFDASGFKNPGLIGKPHVQGIVLRPIQTAEGIIPNESKVEVLETFIKRRKSDAQDGYKIRGLYDPTTSSKGLMLPRNTVDIYYGVTVLPERKTQGMVPQRFFRIIEGG